VSILRYTLEYKGECKGKISIYFLKFNLVQTMDYGPIDVFFLFLFFVIILNMANDHNYTLRDENLNQFRKTL